MRRYFSWQSMAHFHNRSFVAVLGLFVIQSVLTSEWSAPLCKSHEPRNSENRKQARQSPQHEQVRRLAP